MPLLFRRLHEKFDQIDATIERNTRAFEDLQVVIRENRLLQERSLARFEQRMEDMGRQIRANTEATWRMLDRLGEGPTPAS